MSTEYADFIRRAYADAEIQIVKTVKRRLLEGIHETGWAEKKLAEIVKLNRQIGTEVVKLRRYEPGIEAAVETAYNNGARRATDELLKAKIISGPTIREGPKTALRALASQAVTATRATHVRILRSAQDVYRSVVSESVAEGLTGGVGTRVQVAQRTLNRFADRGVTGFVDAKGRQWGLAEYTEMAVRTATGNASTEGHLDKLEAHGHDLLIIPSHWESCPLCAPWEGKIVSATGKTPGYPTLSEAEGDGLLHPNCSHYPQAYIEGLTRPIPASQKARPELYKERQQQRSLERGIRGWKLREAAALDDTAREKASAKVGEWQGRMREFIAEADRRREYGREQIGKAH